MIRPLALAAVFAVVLVAAAPAAATTQTTSSGPVSATFRFHRVDDLRYRHLHLTVTLDGQTVFDRRVRTRDCTEPFCIPGGGRTGPSVRIADIDGDGPPDVILDLFTGGAHCCVESEIVALSDSGAGIRRVEHGWGDPGYHLTDIDGDGVGEFLTGDDRFAYAFAAYAFSALPIQILSFRGDRFRDVTSEHLANVRDDAKRLRRGYRATRARDYPQGVLAAWAADQYRLGQRHAALKFVRAQARRGKLRAAMGPRRAKRFPRRLDRQLRRWGY